MNEVTFDFLDKIHLEQWEKALFLKSVIIDKNTVHLPRRLKVFAASGTYTCEVLGSVFDFIKSQLEKQGKTVSIIEP